VGERQGEGERRRAAVTVLPRQRQRGGAIGGGARSLGHPPRGPGRKAQARAAYEKAAGLAPRDAALQARVGERLRDLGAVDAAIARQTAATELAPSVAAYWNSLGMTLGGNGRAAEAERAFREAARLDAKNARYAYNLGLILERQGRATEARPWYEKALALDGSFAPARARLSGR
jgi:tetratricopeptide (TPR) repeat protein